MLSSPVGYFPRLRQSLTAIFDIYESASENIRRYDIGRNDLVVVGGGGLLHAHEEWSNNILR